MGKRQRGAGARDASFRGHFGTYLLFGVFFFVLNLLTDPGNWWFYWPMFGWGIGVVAHAFATYGADAPARIIELLHDWLGRLVPMHHAPPPPPIPPFPGRSAGARTEQARPAGPASHQGEGTDLERILREGDAKVDAMRREARRIPKSDLRILELE